MPYNTRRVSLSLPSLGIQLPHNSRSAGAHRSPPSLPSTALPPTKRTKRSHTSPTSPASPSATSTASSKPSTIVSTANQTDSISTTSSSTNATTLTINSVPSADKNTIRPGRASLSTGRITQNTPPPSPGDAGGYRIDTDGIDDDVVVAVIEQLDRTGNRPHSAKELAAILINALAVVEGYVDCFVTKAVACLFLLL